MKRKERRENGNPNPVTMEWRRSGKICKFLFPSISYLLFPVIASVIMIPLACSLRSLDSSGLCMCYFWDIYPSVLPVLNIARLSVFVCCDIRRDICYYYVSFGPTFP